MALISTSSHDAAALLNKNDIVAIPTETVYGLAGNAFSEKAIKKIFELKKRPFYNPLIVHIKSVADLNQIATEIPVAAPSANPFGSISPTKAQHVADYFTESSLTVLEGGECRSGIESTIIGFEDGSAVLYRLGSITIEEIENVIGPLKIKTNNEKTPSAPGMLSKHYAPKTKTILTETVTEELKLFDTKRIGLLTYQNHFEHKNIVTNEVLSATGDLAEAASRLYNALHKLDQLKLDVIIAEKFPDHGLGRTINDRLERATKKQTHPKKQTTQQ